MVTDTAASCVGFEGLMSGRCATLVLIRMRALELLMIDDALRSKAPSTRTVSGTHVVRVVLLPGFGDRLVHQSISSKLMYTPRLDCR